MSEFEIKYLKEVLTNLKIIRNDLEYKYIIIYKKGVNYGKEKEIVIFG